MSFIEKHPACQLPYSNKTDFLVTKNSQSIFDRHINRRQFSGGAVRLAQGLFGLHLLGNLQQTIPTSPEPNPFLTNEMGPKLNPTVARVEVGPQYKSIRNTAFIDFGEANEYDTLIQEVYPNWEEVKQQLLGEDYIPYGDFWDQAFTFMGEGHTQEDFINYLMETNHAYVLMLGLQDKLEYHALNVVRTHTNVLKEYGYTTVPHVVEIQPSYSSESLVKDETDRLGNKGISIETKADYFVEKLEDNTEPIISISFQFGRLKLFYARKKYHYSKDTTAGKEAYKANMRNVKELPSRDGTSIYIAYDAVESDDGSFQYRYITQEEFIDYRDKALIEGFAEEIRAREIETSEPIVVSALSGEDAEVNVLELFKLVNAYPEKLFIVAGGNYCDDWRPVREKLNESWPKNLLVAGQWNSETNSPDAVRGQIHGADIYIDMANFGMEGSRPYASNATAILSALANIIHAQERDLFEDREKPSVIHTLQRATKQVEYEVSDEYLKLYDYPNIEKLAQHYFERPKELATVLDKKAIDQIIKSYHSTGL